MMLLRVQFVPTYRYINTLRVSALLTILLLTNESTLTNEAAWRRRFVTVIAHLCKFSPYI